jgi:hypothetical protein
MGVGGSVHRWALVVLGWTASIGCGPDSVFVATVTTQPSQPDSGAKPCMEARDCPGEYCEMGSCGAIDGGTCQPLPTTCALDTPTDVCGCDGVVYLNDCTRKMARVAMHQPCLPPPAFLLCEDATTCPPVPDGLRRVCGRAGGCVDPSKSQQGGVCYVLPATCPPDNSALFAPCDGTHQCMGFCNAIGSEQPFTVPIGPGGPSCQ